MSMRQREKLVIVLNGVGQSGKDTLCSCLADRGLCIDVVSSIDPIKAIAFDNGWDGEKDDKGRKLLSSLKQAFTEYNDAPFMYTCREFARFQKDRASILFVQIREPEEIDKFREHVLHQHVPCVTLLIERRDIPVWDNESDKNVECYDYDYIFYNDSSLEEVGESFYSFIERVLKENLQKEE